MNTCQTFTSLSPFVCLSTMSFGTDSSNVARSYSLRSKTPVKCFSSSTSNSVVLLCVWAFLKCVFMQIRLWHFMWLCNYNLVRELLPLWTYVSNLPSCVLCTATFGEGASYLRLHYNGMYTIEHVVCKISIFSEILLDCSWISAPNVVRFFEHDFVLESWGYQNDGHRSME